MASDFQVSTEREYSTERYCRDLSGPARDLFKEPSLHPQANRRHTNAKHLRGKSKTSAFIDLGDQFLALQKGRTQPPDDGRHFGLVVDDKDAVRRALSAAGIKPLPGPFLDFLDPWGNRVEIVGYDNIQFTKAPNVLRGMGLAHLSKNEKASKELSDKGMAPN